MATCHKLSLAMAILLEIKNKVAVDAGIARRSSSALVEILKGIVVIELADLCGNVQFISFLGSPWDLDTKLVANSKSLGLATGLVEHLLVQAACISSNQVCQGGCAALQRQQGHWVICKDNCNGFPGLISNCQKGEISAKQSVVAMQYLSQEPKIILPTNIGILSSSNRK